MTETATALAQGVFAAWLAAHPATPATSRLRVKGADICPFAESHSHAAQQWLHLPAERGLLNAAQSLVLIDDELSTGNTFRALASALRPQLPALRTTHWLSLTDFSPPAAARDVQRHSLLRGRWHYAATAAVPPVASVQEAPIAIAGSGFGRLGIRQAARLDSAAVTTRAGDKPCVSTAGSGLKCTLNGFANNTDRKHGGFFPLFSWLKESAKPALLFLFPSSILFRPLPGYEIRRRAEDSTDIVKYPKNRNGVAPPFRTICTVCGGAPGYVFLAI